jgi:hypothetical protein
VGGVARAPHDPDGGASGRAGEGEKLDAGVSVECSDGDNSVLDGGGSPGSDCEGTSHFEDQTEDHGLLVGDGAGGDTGGPGVGDIVCECWLVVLQVIGAYARQHTGTVVVCLEQGKEGADGEDVGVLGKHLDDFNTLERGVKRYRMVSGDLVSTAEEVEEHARKIARYIPPAVK